MKHWTKSLILALTLATAAPLAAQAAHVAVDFGNIAFGYNDGYWDRDHHWHRWRHNSDWQRFQRENHEHAFKHRHDHDDNNKGWHEPYWQH